MDATMAAQRARKEWMSVGALGLRLREHLLLKLMLLVGLMIGLYGPFKLIQHFPLRPVVTLPVTWVDQAIPFLPGLAVPYMSFWGYIVAAGLFLTTRADIWRYAWVMIGIGAIGNLVFLVYPTQVPLRPEYMPSAYAFVVEHDNPGNACPSLHVAVTLFSMIVMHGWLADFRWSALLRSIAWVWATVIIFSTAALRQHLSIDVAFGAVLGAAGGIAWYLQLPDMLYQRGMRRQLIGGIGASGRLPESGER